jgi:dolichyl-diphosphooligosaccharide--protein glycosyltransferase
MKKKKEVTKKQSNKDTKVKFDLEKFKNNKLIDVLLVVLAIGLLLFIHHYALEEKDYENYVYFINEEGLPHLFDMDSYYYARKTREFVNGTETKLITTRSQDDLQTNLSDRDDSRYTLLLSKIVSIIYKIVNVFKHVSLYKVIIYKR